MDPTLRKEYYQWIQVLAYYLQAETWPFTDKEISQQDAKAQIVIAAQSLGLDPTDKDIFIKIINKIDELLVGQAKILDTSQLDVVKIRELVEEYEKHLASTQERALKSVFPTLDEQIRANQKKYAELLRNQLAVINTRFKAKVDDKPTILAEVASWDIALENSFALPRIAREVALKKEEYEEAFTQNKPVVEKVLGYAAVKNPKTTTESFIKGVTKEIPSVVKEIAVTSRYLVKEAPLPPPPKFAPEDLVLPEKIAEELAAEPEGVSFLPTYTLLEPRVAGAWAQRAVLFLPAKVIQASTDEATPEWQEMMRGVFVEDIEASISRLKELGLSEKHPIMISLKDKAARLREQQKIKIIKDKETIYKDTLAARILKRYHRFSKLTGRQQIFLEEIKAHLPRLSPAPIWTRGGYSALLRRGLNKLGFVTRLYEGAKIGPYKTVVRPYLSERFMRFITRQRFSSFSQLFETIYRKTLGRLVAKFKEAFWGTFLGRGVKRAATWLATKAGVKLVAGIVSAGVLPAVSAGWETVKKVGKVFLGFLAYLFMVAAHYGPAAVGGLLTGLAIGLPFAGKAAAVTFTTVTGALSFLGPLAPVAGAVSAVVVFFVVEAIFAVAGLLGGIGLQMLLDKIGAGLGGISLPQAGTTGFTQAGAAAASTAKWFVPAAVGTATVGGLIVSQIVSSAFVIPSEKKPSPWAKQSEYIQVEKRVTFKGEVNPARTIDNSEINENTVFTYQFTITATTATLTNIRAEDTITTTQETGTNQIATKVWNNIPDLSVGESWTSDPYDIPTKPVAKFIDSILSNTVTVTADVKEEGLTGEQAFASTTVIIGNPPQDCPRGWPVDTDPIVITQGPRGSFSHPNQEAIDIGRVGNTTSVKATHAGIAYSGNDYFKGNYVSITSTCQGKTFNSLYAHLSIISLIEDGPVTYGQKIGVTGNTGDSRGPHLHYEFSSPGNQIKMAPPNIPAAVPYGDVCTQENPCVY